jgi:uncharacterized membrane protein
MALVVSSTADERRFTFFTVEPEGASSTEALGINSSGAIVGAYTIPGSPTAGFLLDAGVFTRIAFPQASGGPAVTATVAYGINAAGDIVGLYRLAVEGPTEMHGFLRTKAGDFFTVDVPGRMGTVATAIPPDGTILGCSHDQNMTTTMYGFVRDPFGNIMDDAAAGGINPRGQVVGYSWQSGIGYRGFIRDGGAFTTVHHPNANHTLALGINAGGDVVGRYHDGVKWRGFVASRTAQHNK